MDRSAHQHCAARLEARACTHLFACW